MDSSILHLNVTRHYEQNRFPFLNEKADWGLGLALATSDSQMPATAVKH